MSFIEQRRTARKADGTVVADALVKGEVYYGANGVIRRAPAGAYAIGRRGARMAFFGPAGEEAFALPFDSFVQHLQEGHIALVARPRTETTLH
ncbi:MAG: hypothetical protein ACE5FO_13355 [Parvularculaceae bacterium]